LKRGEIWTIAGGGAYAGQPRPVVIIQDDAFDATASVTLCAFTTDPVDAPLMRLAIEPSERNGLRESSRLTVDKITTVPKTKLGYRLGALDDEDVVRLNRAIMVFLGLAGSASTTS
jgi:mRNA interferase MazF